MKRREVETMGKGTLKMIGADHEFIGMLNDIHEAKANGVKLVVGGLPVRKVRDGGYYTAANDDRSHIVHSHFTRGQAVRIHRALVKNGWEFQGWVVKKIGKKNLGNF